MTDTAVETTTEPNVLGVKVGDFFYASWGYDQTNVDFYKVVGLTAKCVKIVKVGNKTVSTDSYSTKVVPGGDVKGAWIRVPEGWSEYDKDATPPVQTKKVTLGYQGRPRLAWTSYADLYFWDGTPQYQTGLGYGH